MTSEHEILWGKVQAFEFDEPGASLTFQQRLARENNWSLSYAQRVIEEYRRFAFLAMTAGHGVTPSEDVDQAWHLHLVYTKNYWEKWCGEVLERPLHHHPTQGGEAEDAKHDDWYRNTLRSYSVAFGRNAPQDIWPSPDEGVHGQNHWVRVNERDHWVMPKFTWPYSRVTSITMLLVIVVITSGILAHGLSAGTPMAGFVVLLAGAEITALLVAWGVEWTIKASIDSPAEDPPPEGPYEVALLASGQKSAVMAAVVELLRRDQVQVLQNGEIEKRPEQGPAELRPLERLILKDVTTPHSLPYLHFALRHNLAEMQQELSQRGWLVPYAVHRSLMGLTFSIAASPAILILARVWSLPDSNGLTLLLVGTPVILGVALLVALRRSDRTAKSKALLSGLRSRMVHMRRSEFAKPALQGDPDSNYQLPWAYAVFGAAILEGTPYEEPHRRLARTAETSGPSAARRFGRDMIHSWMVGVVAARCSGGGGCGVHGHDGSSHHHGSHHGCGGGHSSHHSCGSHGCGGGGHGCGGGH